MRGSLIVRLLIITLLMLTAAPGLDGAARAADADETGTRPIWPTPPGYQPVAPRAQAPFKLEMQRKPWDEFIPRRALGDDAGAAQTTANKFSTEPVLRLELGQHSAGIWTIDVDKAGRYLVTGSQDKTARVWAIPQRRGEAFRLLRVLRPPIGTNQEGRIYAVAISPDGRLVAVAGWTGQQWDGTTGRPAFSIYLFDRASGRLIRRLGPLPNVILSLAFAPNGRTLAAGMFGANGIALFRARDGALIGRDSTYKDLVYGLSFARDGRLATTSFDGFIRLYAAGAWNAPAGSVKAPNGGQPFGIAFDPSGERLVVGYEDTSSVSVLDGKTLEHLFAAPTYVAGGSEFSSVAWSRDGAKIYAGGIASLRGTPDNFILVFGDGGRRFERDVAVSTNRVVDIRALKGGDIVYGGVEPVFGILRSGATAPERFDSAQIDMRKTWPQYAAARKSLRISRDGRAISLPFDRFGEDYLRFSVESGRLDVVKAEASDLAPPRLSAPGLSVRNWIQTTRPSLNGNPLQLQRSEISRSLAVTPSGDKFLLGTEWYVRLFDKTGKQIWSKSAPGVTYRVNNSGDGRIAVAAFTDGTIRWHDMRNGNALLALFVTPDPKDPKWIAWIPEGKNQGYYAASPGAEDLVGWHVNQAKDKESLFYSIGKYRDRFYRPDIISQVLSPEALAADDPTAKAVEIANAARGQAVADVSLTRGDLLPVVHILSPEDGASFNGKSIALQFSIDSPSNKPIASLQISVDGRPQETITSGLTPGKAITHTFTGLPQRDIVLSLIASTADGPSEDARVLLHYLRARGDGAPMRVDTVQTPGKLYVLSIGVNAYRNLPGEKQLQFAANDARDFLDLMKQRGKGFYKEVIAYPGPDGKGQALVNEAATAQNVRDGLAWLQYGGPTSDDTVMLFIAGHGWADRANRYYFLPSDADASNPAKISATAIGAPELQGDVQGIRSRFVLFIDTCHSGGAMAPGGFAGSPGRPVITTFGVGPGATPIKDVVSGRGAADITPLVSGISSALVGGVVFSASTGTEPSYERADWQHGAFTKAVLDGLSGKADFLKTGFVTVSGLNYWVSNEVSRLTTGLQQPVEVNPKVAPDFKLMRVGNAN